ncbi:MAG: hypothetical protein R2911_40120 [Caldilineaceae bacterium]
MVFKNLVCRFTRSFLTVMGIAVGVAAVVALGRLTAWPATMARPSD